MDSVVAETPLRFGSLWRRRWLSAFILLLCLQTLAARAQDRQAMPTIPKGLQLITPALYSYGVAVGPDGTTYWTEYGRNRIMKRKTNGQVSVVRQDLARVYGLACDANSNLFIGIDSSDPNSDGSILKRTSGGTETTIVSGLQRPRQLATDSAGNVYFVLEGGSVCKWTAATNAVTTLATGLPTPQGVAVKSDGTVFISTYMAQDGQGMPTAYGKVWVIRPGQTATPLATGFYRGRGLAEMNGSLYLWTESNYYDNGNSGLLLKIDETSGALTTVLAGLDYPEFAAAGNGKIYTTLGRDNWLVAFDPATLAAYSDTTWPGASPTINYGAENGGWTDNGTGNLAFNTNGLILPGTRGSSDPVTGWIRVPASYFTVSPTEITPCSGTYHLPQTLYKTPNGTCFIAVLPLRQQTGTRWPQTGGCSNNSNFSEVPTAYLIYFRWIPGDWANDLVAPSYNSDHVAILHGSALPWFFEGTWTAAAQTWLQAGKSNSDHSAAAYAEISLGAFSGTKKYIYVMWHKNGSYRPHSAQYGLGDSLGADMYNMTVNQQYSADGLNHPDDTFSGWKLFGNRAYYIRPDTFLRLWANNPTSSEYLQSDAVMVSDYPIVGGSSPGASTNFTQYPPLSVTDTGPTGLGHHWGLEGLGYLYGQSGQTGYSLTQRLDENVYTDAGSGSYYVDVSWDYVNTDNVNVPNARYAINGTTAPNVVNQNRSSGGQSSAFVAGNSRGTWSSFYRLGSMGTHTPGSADLQVSLSYQGTFSQHLVGDMVRFVPVNPAW